MVNIAIATRSKRIHMKSKIIKQYTLPARAYLLQILYVLFANPHEEQLEIFSTLQAYMMPFGQSEDVQLPDNLYL